MLRDAEYFKTRIGSLDGANDASDYIIKVIKDKNVPRRSTSPSQTANSNPNTAQVEGSHTAFENGNENGNGNT